MGVNGYKLPIKKSGKKAIVNKRSPDKNTVSNFQEISKY